jgi:DNA gyrase subunit A
MERGKVVRSSVTGVPAKGRDTMGVVFAKPDSGDRIIAVAKNSERSLGDDENAGGEESPDYDDGSSASSDATPGDTMASDQGDSPPNAGGGDDQERSG